MSRDALVRLVAVGPPTLDRWAAVAALALGRSPAWGRATARQIAADGDSPVTRLAALLGALPIPPDC